MYEDSALELASFEPGGRVFCIASAGCTAFDLAARGDDVTAVDVNAAQVAYVRTRVAGEPSRRGRVDRALDEARRVAPAIGWRREALERLCSLADPEAQLGFWRRHLDTRRFRLALAVALSRPFLRRLYSPPFVSALPPRFSRTLRLRFERGLGRHPNAANPYVASLFLGRARETTPLPVRLETADAAEFLEHCPAASFDGFSLSNVLDGTDARYADRLFASVKRAATPGAVVILRSLAEPTSEEQSRFAADDRSLIWGAIRIERV